MPYDPKIVEAVDEQFRLRREKNQSDLAARRAAAYKKEPRIRKIDEALAARYRDLILAGLGGKAPSKSEIRAVTVDHLAERGELLVQNGFPPDYLELKTACRKCGDEGFINGRLCTCYKKALCREAASRTKLARLMEEQSFRTFRLDLYPEEDRKIMERIFQKRRDYAQNFSPSSGNLLFTGPPGVGKTFLSSAIAREVLESGHSVVYDSISAVIADFEAVKFGKDSDRDLKKYDSCDLLILDDLGTEMITQFSESVLYTLLNDRINARRPMIVSTNLDAQNFSSFYSGSILSRLSGEFLVMPFRGDDLRQKPNRRKKSEKA